MGRAARSRLATTTQAPSAWHYCMLHATCIYGTRSTMVLSSAAYGVGDPLASADCSFELAARKAPESTCRQAPSGGAFLFHRYIGSTLDFREHLLQYAAAYLPATVRV